MHVHCYDGFFVLYDLPSMHPSWTSSVHSSSLQSMHSTPLHPACTYLRLAMRLLSNLVLHLCDNIFCRYAPGGSGRPQQRVMAGGKGGRRGSGVAPASSTTAHGHHQQQHGGGGGGGISPPTHAAAQQVDRKAVAHPLHVKSTHTQLLPHRPLITVQHIEGEDRRVKRLTESVLYDFLPAALQVMLPQVRCGGCQAL